MRAVIGYLARAGVIQPAPSAPDRVAGRVVGAWDRNALAVCTRGHAGGHARALAPVPLGLGVGRGRRCRRRGHPAPLRRPLGAGARRARAATSAIRRWSRPRRCAASRQSALGPAADLEGAILESWTRREPGVGRTRASRSCAAGARRRSTKHSYDGLPSYGAYRDLRADDVLAAIDALVAAGRLRLAGGRFPKLEVVGCARLEAA